MRRTEPSSRGPRQALPGPRQACERRRRRGGVCGSAWALEATGPMWGEVLQAGRAAPLQRAAPASASHSTTSTKRSRESSLVPLRKTVGGGDSAWLRGSSAAGGGASTADPRRMSGVSVGELRGEKAAAVAAVAAAASAAAAAFAAAAAAAAAAASSSALGTTGGGEGVLLRCVRPGEAMSGADPTVARALNASAIALLALAIALLRSLDLRRVNDGRWVNEAVRSLDFLRALAAQLLNRSMPELFATRVS